jgi:hypothetical protein
VSIHLEKSEKETNNVIENIIALNQNFKKFINVNLMCVAGKLEQWQKISHLLNQHNVKHVLRRIRPNFDEDQNILQPHDHRRNRQYAMMSVEQQKNFKNEYKLQRSNKLLELYQQYYSDTELEWLNSNAPEQWWQNLGIWYNDHTYIEGNSDDLVTRNDTVFTGWTCCAGIDQLYIDFDGTIYRGYCGNDGEIGHISSTLNLPTEPTICAKAVCTSNPDIVVRKCRPGWEKNIGIDTKILNNQ